MARQVIALNKQEYQFFNQKRWFKRNLEIF